MMTDTIPVIGILRHRSGTDGTGIRTLIGTAGCPLRCKYCLNPHSWNGKAVIHEYSPDALYEMVKIDNLYFRTSGGGITFGGGEPLLHMTQIAKFRTLCPPEWTVYVETSLYTSASTLALAAKTFDHFIVDIKTTDPTSYYAYTSKHLDVPLQNLKKLCNLVDPARITVRIPHIPGYTDSNMQLQSIHQISALGIQNIDTFSYTVKQSCD